MNAQERKAAQNFVDLVQAKLKDLDVEPLQAAFSRLPELVRFSIPGGRTLTALSGISFAGSYLRRSVLDMGTAASAKQPAAASTGYHDRTKTKGRHQRARTVAQETGT